MYKNGLGLSLFIIPEKCWNVLYLMILNQNWSFTNTFNNTLGYVFFLHILYIIMYLYIKNIQWLLMNLFYIYLMYKYV